MPNYNFGSGTNRKQDYISVDLYAPEADEHWDITKELPLEDNSVDNIYACHVIEHLDRAEWEVARKEWIRVLKPGGSIEILCPNIIEVCAQVILDHSTDTPNPFTIMQLYGLQSTPGEYHKNGFTPKGLEDSFPELTAESLPGTDSTELHMRFTK